MLMKTNKSIKLEDVTDLTFVKGKHRKSFSNLYMFESPEYKVEISERLGEFDSYQKSNHKEGKVETSEYLLYDIYKKDKTDESIGHGMLWRGSEDFKQLTEIRRVLSNINNSIAFCEGCMSIIGSNYYIPNRKKCVHCDMYTCKKCKRKFSQLHLENGVCEDCRTQN